MRLNMGFAELSLAILIFVVGGKMNLDDKFIYNYYNTLYGLGSAFFDEMHIEGSKGSYKSKYCLVCISVCAPE